MALCYDRENARTMENGATFKTDTTIEVCNIMEKTYYKLDAFYLLD